MKRILIAIFLLLMGQVGAWAYTTINSLSSNTTWSSGTYYIATSIDDATHTLTINSGVIVKMGSGISLATATLTVNGTYSNPVYFTSMNDNTIGDTITGSSGTPAAGDWGHVANNEYNTTVSITYAFMKYGTICVAANTNIGADTLTIASSVISNCTTGIGFISGINSTTVSITNTQILNNSTGMYDIGYSGTLNNLLFKSNSTYAFEDGYTAATMGNATFDSNGTAIYMVAGSGTLALTNSIVSNNTVNLSNSSGTETFNYVNQYNNTTTNTAGTITNAITGNPTYQTGTAATGYIGNMTYFLTQASSPDVNSGSASSSSLGMNTLTTNITAAVDSGTVDVGYHYNPNDVYYSSGVVNHNGFDMGF